MKKRKTVFSSAVFLSLAVFSVQTLSQYANASRTAATPGSERSQFNKKIVESLSIDWRSIEYEKRLYNPAYTSNKQGQPKAESLSLSFEIEKSNSGLILTICIDAIIEQVTDSQGNNIEFVPISSESSLMYFYIPSLKGNFMAVEQPVRPELPTLKVRLDTNLLEQINGEIGLKGYFYALTAESLEYVELPFRPSDKWVCLTPDVEVRVRKAQNEASQYKFDIEQRPENVIDLSRVQIGDYLPSRLIVERQFIGKTSAVGTGGGGASGRIGGKGNGIGRAEKICYIIAVNPAHQIIPFEIKQIPLSEVAGPVSSQTNSQNRPNQAPFGRQMQNITHRSTTSRAQKLPEQVKPQFNKEIADCFEIDWNSITYRKIFYNSPVSGKSRNRKVLEKLLLRCEAKTLDPNLIIGTCNIPIIEQITDDKGRDNDLSTTQSYSHRMYYSTLEYKQNIVRTPLSSLAYWEIRIRSALGLPLRVRNRSKRTSVLQPVRMKIELDPGLLRQDTGEIGSIKGYFQALTAESFKHVEVPFKPDNKWVRLTSDVEIQVRRAWHTDTGTRFDIRQRKRTGVASNRIYIGDDLPDGIVVERQFIEKDGQSTSFSNRREWSLPGNISGSGRIGGRQIEKIDFLIAVDPNHNMIPLEFEHIPLPKP